MTPTEPNVHGLRQAILPLAITLAVQVLVSLTAVSVAILMPVVAAELHFSPNYVGLFVSLIYLGACISSPFSGYLIDQFGPVSVSQVCLVLCAAGLGLMSIASIWLMVSGAIIIGFGYGPVTPASSYLLVRTTPARAMAIMFSIKQTGVPLGGAVAGALVPYCVISYGWQRAAIGVAALMLFSAVAILPFRQAYDRWRRKGLPFSLNKIAVSIRAILSHQELFLVVLASVFFAVMQLCLISFIVTYLTQDIGMTLIQAGLMLSVAQAAGIMGRIAWGALADKLVKPRIMLGILGVAMSLLAVLTALFTAAWPHYAILIVCALFGAVAIGWNGVYLAEVAWLAKPEHAGEVTGGALFFTFCGVLFGLPILSMVFDLTNSYSIGFLLVAVSTACCGAFLLFSSNPGRLAGHQK